MTINESDPLVAVIRYKTSAADIHISRISEKHISADVPATTQSRWIEKINNANQEIYTLTTRGVMIISLTYHRNDGRRFMFYDDADCITAPVSN